VRSPSTAGFFSTLALALLRRLLRHPACRQRDRPSFGPPRATAAPAPSLGDFHAHVPRASAKLRPGLEPWQSLDCANGETMWGNPRVTPELLAALRGGFPLVRIPRHLGAAPGARTELHHRSKLASSGWRVVGFARSAGLYSIINLHPHGADGMRKPGGLSLKDADGKTTEEKQAAVRAQSR